MARTKLIRSEAELFEAAGRKDWAGVESLIAEAVAPLDIYDREVDPDGFSMNLVMETYGTTFTMRYPFILADFWRELGEVETSTWDTWSEMQEEDGDVQPLKLATGGRLHTAIGSPGLAALGAYLAGGETDIWDAPSELSAGDLLLTLLDVQPPTILCLERVARDRSPRHPTIEVWGDESYEFTDVFKNAIDKRLSGTPIPMSAHTFSARRADAVLTALAQEIGDPTPLRVIEGKRSLSSSRHRSSGLQAVVIRQSGGRCECCGTDYLDLLGGKGIAALEVHHRKSLAQSDDELIDSRPRDLVVLCGACHNLIHRSGISDIDVLRYELRPPCPQCGSHKALEIVYGALLGPLPDHQTPGGCDVVPEAPEWSCGECQHRW